LRDDAFHEEKKEKGENFESAKLLITRGYPALLPAKHIDVGKAASTAGAASCIPFFVVS
jgi:hypothetical protein